MEVTCLVEDEFERDVLTRATNFFSRKLGFRRKDVGIIIAPAPGLTDSRATGAIVSEVEPGLMLIAIDTNSELTIQVQHLAHELVHVKQLISGRLVIERRRKKARFYWKGEDLTGLPYHKRPWEREAMHKEVVLTYELFGLMKLDVLEQCP